MTCYCSLFQAPFSICPKSFICKPYLISNTICSKFMSCTMDGNDQNFHSISQSEETTSGTRNELTGEITHINSPETNTMDLSEQPPLSTSEPNVIPPPSYEAATALLPSYGQVQQEKRLEAQIARYSNPPQYLPPPESNHNLDIQDAHEANNANIIGTDLKFCGGFLTAFVLNWIGLLIVMGYCNTIASKYGAISGFGLSLSKWIIILKHTKLISRESSWLWWLVIALGIIVCFRAIIQYVSVKRGWGLLPSLAHERIYFY